MAIGIDGIDRSIKNIAELSFRDLDTDLVLNLPKPSSFMINRGFGQKRVPTVDAKGSITYADNYVVSEDPQLQIMYSQWQPELMGLKIGTKFEEATKTLNISKAFDVYVTGVALPLNIGGVGIVINGFEASYTVGNLSVDATALLTVDTGAKTVTFQAGLANKRVTFQFNITVTGVSSTAKKVSNHSVAATLIATDDEIIFLEIPKVSINFETAQLNPSAEQIDLNFFINAVAGRCEPYDLIYSGEYIEC
jgi:hypothetical protein